MQLLNAAFLGTPILVAATWWRWLTKANEQQLPSWRVSAVLVGAIAISVNAVLYYSWTAYAFTLTHMEDAADFRNKLGNNVGLPLFLLALAAATFGKGSARMLLAASAVSGMLVWIPAGFL